MTIALRAGQVGSGQLGIGGASLALSAFPAGSLAAGCIVVVQHGGIAETFSAPTDDCPTGSNTYVLARTQASAGNRVAVWYTWNAAAGATVVTLHQSGASQVMGGSAAEATGVDAASDPLDQVASAFSEAFSTPASGSITPTVDGCLVIGAQRNDSNAPVTDTGTGWTTLSNQTLGGAEYQIQTTAAAANATWTDTDLSWAAVVVAFRPAEEEEEEAVWLPYLATVPSGRTGRIDPLTKRTDVGMMTFRVQDHALVPGPVNQATRWLSAFFGDAFGRSRWLGLKAVCEESLDGGETWTPYWTGRIQGVRAVGKLQFDFAINDMSEDLKALVGVGQPHPDVQGYAGTFSLLPLGPQAPYGLLSPPTPLGAFDRTPLFGLGRLVTIFNENRDIPTNVVTEELLAGSTPGIRNLGGDLTNYHFVPNDDGPLRVLIRHLTGAHADEVGVYRVGFLITGQRPNGTAFVTDFEIHALGDPDAPGALALPAGVNLEVLSMWQDAGISETQPLLINDQHPVRHIQDIANGYYGWRYKPRETLPPGVSYGDPKRSVTPETASFAALLADPSFPTARLWLEAIEPGGDVIENLCQGYQLGIIFNGAGELVVVDLRIPTVTPTLELTDADVVAAADFDWSLDRDKSVQRVNATYYYDYQVPPEDLLSRGETLPSIRKAIVQPLRSVLEVLEVGPSDLGDTALDIDGRGYRYMDGEVIENRTRLEYEKAQLAASARCLTYPFGSGGVTCQLTFRRTANALQVQPGTLLLLTVSWLPDPWTNKRGGTRVVRCTDLTREGATITARFLDYGSGGTASMPSIGTPAQMPGNESHGAHAVYTSNAQGDTIEVQVAVTNGGSAPSATDPAWHLVSVIGLPDTPPWTYDLYAYALPAGGRVWFRARSRPGATNRLQQASGWVVSTSVDLDPLDWPTSIVPSDVESTHFSVSFTPGDTALRTEVLLRQSVADNGSFETDIVGTQAVAGATLVRDNAHAHVVLTGTWSCKVTTANASGSGVRFTRRDGAMFPVVPGEDDTFGVWVYAPAGSVGKTLRLDIDWYNIATLLLHSTTPFTLIAGWQQMTLSGVAPAGATGADIECVTTAAEGVFDVWVDDVQFMPTDYRVVTTLPPGAPNHVVTGLLPGSVVDFQLRHTDGAGGYSILAENPNIVMLDAGNDADLPALTSFNLTQYAP